MKKRSLYLATSAIFILGMCLFNSCTNKKSEKGEDTTSITSSPSADLDASRKAALWDIMFEGDNKIVGANENFLAQPVKYELAKACVEEYKKQSKDPSITSIPAKMKMLKTLSIRFSNSELTKWMDTTFNAANTDAKFVCIRLGVYTLPILKEYGKPDSLEGKLTVFIWPYKTLDKKNEDDNEAEGHKVIGGKKSIYRATPFNLGEIHPRK